MDRSRTGLGLLVTMAGFKATAVLVLTLCVVVMSDDSDYQAKTRFCGSNLVQILEFICNGHYQPMFKKSEAFGASAQWGVPVEWPLFARRLSSSSGRRVRRGVVQECCLEGCTLAVLQSYCAE